MNNDLPATYPQNAGVHIALHVGDLKRSIDFYRLLFGREPSKVRDRYAKFEPLNPSLNLALNESSKSNPQSEGLSHFGIEVDSTEAVMECAKKFERAGLKVEAEIQVSCCYAVQDKIWVNDPDGNAWEVFFVTQKEAPVCCVEQKEESLTACC